MGAEMRPKSSTATTAPTSATATRRDQRPVTRARFRHRDGGSAVGSAPAVPGSAGSLTRTPLSSGGGPRRAEDPAQRGETDETDGRGGPRGPGDLGADGRRGGRRVQPAEGEAGRPGAGGAEGGSERRGGGAAGGRGAAPPPASIGALSQFTRSSARNVSCRCSSFASTVEATVPTRCAGR